MELPILIEPIAGGRMRARLGEPFDVVAEADDAERAVQDLVRLVESRIKAGARVAALTLNNDTVRATVSPVPADNAYQADGSIVSCRMRSRNSAVLRTRWAHEPVLARHRHAYPNSIRARGGSPEPGRSRDSEVALAAVTLQEQMRGWLAHLNKLSDPAQIADWYDRLEGVYREHWQHFLGWSDEGLLLHPTAREVAVFWDNGRWVGRRSKRRVYMKRRK